MNTHKSLVSLFSDIANAIRAKTGSGGTIKADNFPSAIRSIETGTDTSDATASASDILSGKTAYGSSGKLTGTIASKAASDVTASDNTVTVPAGYYGEAVTKTVGTKKTAQTYTPGTTDQTIAAGQYLSGAQTIKGDADLVAANIKKDVQIFGVTGTFEGGTDISDTTATAADVLSPKKFHLADGTLATGTITTKTSSNVSVSGATVTVPAGYYASQVQKSVASGTAGTPTATKSVGGHTATITPTVTNTEGYISGGTKTGTQVRVTASELVSGTLVITENGTVDVTNFANVSVNVASEQPTLNAPTISRSGITLTITNPASNGNFVTGYKVYANGSLIATVQTTTVDLSSYISGAGSYTITAKASGSNFNDSAASNSVSYNTKIPIAPVLSQDASGNVYITNNNTIDVYYTLFVDGVEVGTDGGISPGQTYNSRISRYISSDGTYTITASFCMGGYADSDISEPLTYVVAGGNVTFTVYNGNKNDYGYAYFKFDDVPTSNSDYDFYVQGGYDGAAPSVYGSIVPGGEAYEVDGKEYQGSASVIYAWGNSSAYVEVDGQPISLPGSYSSATQIPASGAITISITADSFDD